MSEPVGLPQSTTEILASVAQHRVLTTAQIRAIHFPGRTLRRARQVMASLEATGLIDHVQAPGTLPRRLWYLTSRGSATANASGVLDNPPRPLDPGQAAGQLRAHTMAVNDVGIAFLQAARKLGDDFGPLSWHHEVSHPLSETKRRRYLRADAVLTYLRGDAGEVYIEQRFIEVDRATLSTDRLASELAAYTGLFLATNKKGEPIWQRRYPAFPPVVCVLAGAEDSALERRKNAAIALLRRDPERNRTPEVAISFCLATDLAKHGPFGRIFRDIQNPEVPCDWLGDRSEA